MLDACSSFYQNERNIKFSPKLQRRLWRDSIMLPSIFEEHRVCSNRTKSLLIVNQSNIISKKNQNFAMEWCFVI